MSGTEHMLLIAAARSKRVRLILQRWALRYASRLLYKLDPAHHESAQLLAILGSVQGDGNTLTGRPLPRKPAPVVSLPRLYTKTLNSWDE